MYTLSSLTLARNQFVDNGMKYLADALRINTTFTYLDLSEIEIEDKGMEYLAEDLCDNK
ncbi:unnamed protein product, partial [Rotaria sordida]